MTKCDIRDWYIIVHISLFALLVMGYVFWHPSEGAFGTACGTLTTVISLYHWFTQRDDKTPDAPCSSSQS